MSSFTVSSRAGDVRRSIGLWRPGRQNEIERAVRDRLRLGSRDRETRQIGAAARPFHLSTMGKTGALPDIAGTSGWPLHIEKLTTRRLFGRQRPMYTPPETLPLQQGRGNAAPPSCFIAGDASARQHLRSRLPRRACRRPRSCLIARRPYGPFQFVRERSRHAP